MARKQILIVEDAMDLGRLLQATLSTLSVQMNVQVVPSAEEAMLEVNQKDIDLLITDIRLPGISGMELLRKIRNRKPNIKVIVITGLTDPRLRQEARDLQVDHFMRKPLEIPDFILAVQQTLSLTDEEVAPPGTTPRPGKSSRHMPDILADLRVNLDAQSVILLDEVGHVTAMAGELPSQTFDEWAGTLLGVISANAKLVRLLGEAKGETTLTFRGEKTDLLLLPINDLAMLMIVRASHPRSRLLASIDAALEARQELAGILAGMGLGKKAEAAAAVSEPEPRAPSRTEAVQSRKEEVVEQPAVVEDPTQLAELADQLSRSAKTVRREDADAFWDAASTGGINTLTKPDMITFDQAQQLGLGPAGTEPEK